MIAPGMGRLGRTIRGWVASLAPTPVSWSGHLPRASVQALAIVLGTALLLARQTGLPAVRSIWAEDGMFLAQAFEPDPLAVWFRPYAGYLHAVPRTIATLATLLPLEWASVALAGGAALLVACLALYVFRATGGIIESNLIRLWLAALPLILPVVEFEAMNNVSNLQFFLLYAAVWALLARPRTSVDRWAGVAVVLMTTLSSALSFLLLPLVLVRLAKVREPSQHLVTVAWLIGVAVQAAVVVSANGAGATESPPVGWLADLYALRILLSAALGIKVADGAWATLGQGAALLAALAAIGIGVYVVTRPVMRSRGSAGLLFLLSAVFFFVAMGLRWSPLLIPTPDSLGLGASRHTVVPILLVFAAVAFVLDAPDPRFSRKAWRNIVLTTVGGSLLISGVDYFSVDNRREDGPDWIAGVHAARLTCAATGAATTEIATTPSGWTVELPCQRLAPPGGAPP